MPLTKVLCDAKLNESCTLRENFFRVGKHLRFTLEACVETLDQATEAVERGAHRLELCRDLSVGGITPSDKLVKKVLKKCPVPVRVMVRPRGGDFVYSEAEFDEMLRTLDRFQKLGVREVVTGFLQPETHRIDTDRTQRFCEHAATAGMTVTFHKAIDETPDPVVSLMMLHWMTDVTSVLSSGGAASALEGVSVLREMQDKCRRNKQITLVVAGGVTPESLRPLYRRTGAMEYHGRRIVDLEK